MSHMEGVQELKIPLEEIKLATNNFSDENFIARGGFGKVYVGELSLSGQQSTIAVKRLDRTLGQGDREFLMEIQMLSCYKHKNLVSLLGFCDESGESILVYEYAKHGSLDKYLSGTELSWMQRLQISLGAARGFNYLHNDVGPQHRVLHRDIKSSNILLNENWEAKISDFGLSKISPSNVKFTFLVTSACGTLGYVDPQYIRTGILTKESDVYSFGVVLFEILCGRLALIDRYQDERRFIASLAQQHYERNTLHEIIHPDLMNQMNVDSLNMFSMVAYQCLNENRSKRPTMGWIVEKLETALELQLFSNWYSLGATISVIGSQFIAPSPLEIIVDTVATRDLVITDINHKILLKVKPWGKSFHRQHVLLDVDDKPIVMLREKIWTSHDRWDVFRGKTKANSDMIFCTKTPDMFQSETSLHVFLANKTSSKNVCDFMIEGSWSKRNCTIFMGDSGSSTAIAQMNTMQPLGKFMVRICANVDYAFVVVLIAIVDAMESSKDQVA